MRTLLIILLLINTSLIIGQDAPQTTAATVNNPAPGSIIIPVTVTGFQNIGSVSLSLDYSVSVLNFVQGTPNPSLSGFIISDNDLGNGIHRLIMGWYGWNAVSLPDSSSIMDIEFTYLSGTTSLAWYDNGGSCEYADENFVVLNDIPAEDFYFDGYVCGAIGIPTPISGDSSVCQGETSVFYSIDTIPNATGYAWSVPEGAIIISGQNTNAITVDYSDTAVSGYVSVAGINACDSGQQEQKYVSVNILPVANAGNDTVIPNGTSTTLHAASGGEGNFSYYWMPPELLVDPNVQNPQTVILTSSTLFTLEVTNDSTFCQNYDDLLVTVSGGALCVNPATAPPEICIGDSSQLYANAGGGSGNYTYSWSATPTGNPPWTSAEANPQVSPDTTTVYTVEVYDGFTTTSGNTILLVNELPTAFIYGDDTLCGEEDSALITIEFTGTAEWSVVYSNGYSTWQINNIDTALYQFYVFDSGTYVVLEVEDANCVGTSSGNAVIEKYPIPNVPVISQDGDVLSSDIVLGNQWYLNDEEIPGATGQFYTAQVNGLYYDIVTVNSCVSDTSNSIYVIVTSVNEIRNDYFRVAPNPARNKVKILSGNHFTGKVNVRLFSVSGLLINDYILQLADGKSNQTIDISSLTPGLYFLKISNKDAVTVSKMVVR